MVLESKFTMHHKDYILETLFNSDRIEREIIYDWSDGSFLDIGELEGECDIPNIYEEIDPLHIELLRIKEEDMIVRDRIGRLTLLTVMPF